MGKVRNLGYLGACFSSGQPIKGTELTPQALRQSGLFQSLLHNHRVSVTDYGDVHQCPPLTSPPSTGTHINNLHILDPSLHSLNNRVLQLLPSIDDQQQVLLTVGGDHSIATGSIHALLHKYPQLRIIWVDAHADLIDVRKSPYPNYHGMPLSHLLGVNEGGIGGFAWMSKRVKAGNIVYVGLRDIDVDEYETISRLGIRTYTMDHVDMLGIGEVMRQAMQYLDPHPKPLSPAPFHISFDIDAVDPSLSPATGTRFRGGLTHREACHIVRRVNWEKKLVSMDLVEINPLIGDQSREKYRGEEMYQGEIGGTLGMGVDLVNSLFTRYLSL